MGLRQSPTAGVKSARRKIEVGEEDIKRPDLPVNFDAFERRIREVDAQGNTHLAESLRSAMEEGKRLHQK